MRFLPLCANDESGYRIFSAWVVSKYLGVAAGAVRGGPLNSILPHYARQIGKIFNYISLNIELCLGKLEFRTGDVTLYLFEFGYENVYFDL